MLKVFGPDCIEPEFKNYHSADEVLIVYNEEHTIAKNLYSAQSPNIKYD
jgi:hypothetical protein